MVRPNRARNAVAEAIVEATSSRPSRRAKEVAAAKLNHSYVEPNDEESEADEEADVEAEEGSDESATESQDEEFEDLPKKTSRKRASTAGNKADARETYSAAKSKKSKKNKSTKTKLTSESSLYAALLAEDAQFVLDAWLQTYAEEQYIATAEILSLFVRCCGCKEEVTTDMLSDVQKACQTLTENFDEDSDTYPLLQKTKAHKTFKHKLESFIEVFVESGRSDVFQDGYLLPTLLSWLTSLCTSAVRAFRHTCTFISLKIGEELITAYSAVDGNLRKVEKQIGAEARSGGKAGKKPSQRKATLATQSSELTAQRTVFEENLNLIFSGVIMNRYRDTSEDIRQITIEELGNWVHELPSLFLDDTYLKYLGWAINDKEAAVRSASLSGLAKIYSLPDVEDSIALFTERFKPRMLQCCEDISESVQCTAIKMVTALAGIGALEIEEADAVLEFIFCETASVSSAAAELFMKIAVEDDLLPMLEEFDEGKQSSIDDELRAKIVLRHIVCKSQVMGTEILTDNKAYYVVDALWRHIPELADWEAYHSLLEQDNVAGDEDELQLTDTTLTPAQEVLLFQILGAATKKAVGMLHLPAHRKTKFGTQQIKAIEEEQHNLSEFLVKKMPDLFAKFSSDTAKALVLVEMPQCFDLECYESTRSVKQFEATAKLVCDVLQKTPNEQVMGACAATLDYFIVNEFPLSEKADAIRASTLDKIVAQLLDITSSGIPLNDVDADDVDADENVNVSSESFQLITCLCRLQAIGNSTNISLLDGVLPCVQRIIQHGVDDDVHERALAAAIGVNMMLLVYNLGAVYENPSRGIIDEVVLARDALVKNCDRLLTSGTQIVQRAAYCALMDTAVAFTRRFASDDVDTLYHPLGLLIDVDVQDRLFDYLSASVLDVTDEADAAGGMRSKRKQSTAFITGRQPKRARRDHGDHSDDEDGDDDLSAEMLVLTLEDAQAAAEREVQADHMLAALDAFSVSVLSGSINTQYLGRLMPYYTKSVDVRDTIKHILKELRESDPKGCAEAILMGLQLMYEEVQSTREKDMSHVRDLASRLAMTYGTDKTRTETRQSIINIHRRGIDYALSGGATKPGQAPDLLSFLEIIKEFSRQLHKVDIAGPRGVKEYIASEMRRYKLRAVAGVKEWVSYHLFMDNLSRDGGAKVTPARRKSAAGGSAKRKSRSASKTSRKRLQMSRDDSGTAESDDGFWGKLPTKKARTPLGEEAADDNIESYGSDAAMTDDFVQDDFAVDDDGNLSGIDESDEESGDDFATSNKKQGTGRASKSNQSSQGLSMFPSTSRSNTQSSGSGRSSVRESPKRRSARSTRTSKPIPDNLFADDSIEDSDDDSEDDDDGLIDYKA
eukprot:m.514983 g.514983  ORF g.514983 m.514983 type:complete len:1356 (-) comp21916_c0_seq2:2344-6411(-)